MSKKKTVKKAASKKATTKKSGKKSGKKAAQSMRSIPATTPVEVTDADAAVTTASGPAAGGGGERRIIEEGSRLRPSLENVEMITISDPSQLILIEDKNHPLYTSRVFNKPDPLWVERMMEHGCPDPLWVASIPGLTDDQAVDPQYLVIDGRQRTITFREAHAKGANIKLFVLPLMECHPDAAPDSEEMMAAVDLMVVANNFRKEETDIGRAEHVAHLHHTAGYGTKLLSGMFAKSQQTIRNWLSVIENLKPEQTELVRDGRMTFTDAMTVSRLPTDRRDEEIEKVVKETTPANETPSGKARRANSRPQSGSTTEREPGGVVKHDDNTYTIPKAGLEFIAQNVEKEAQSRGKKLPHAVWVALMFAAGAIPLDDAAQHIPGLQACINKYKRHAEKEAERKEAERKEREAKARRDAREAVKV